MKTRRPIMYVLVIALILALLPSYAFAAFSYDVFYADSEYVNFYAMETQCVTITYLNAGSVYTNVWEGAEKINIVTDSSPMLDGTGTITRLYITPMAGQSGQSIIWVTAENTDEIIAIHVNIAIPNVEPNPGTTNPPAPANPPAPTVEAPDAPDMRLRVTGMHQIKIAWDRVSGADGYLIYRYNSADDEYKLIKTITSSRTTSWTNKNLKKGESKKYKMKAYTLTEDGDKVTSKFSKMHSATPRENAYKEKPSISFPDSEYGGPVLKIKKVSYVNGKVRLTALVLNNRVFDATKFDWIRIKVYHDDTVIAMQKFKNVRIGLDGYDAKAMTFTFDTGTKKTDVNLRYGDVFLDYEYSYYYSY